MVRVVLEGLKEVRDAADTDEEVLVAGDGVRVGGTVLREQRVEAGETDVGSNASTLDNGLGEHGEKKGDLRRLFVVGGAMGGVGGASIAGGRRREAAREGRRRGTVVGIGEGGRGGERTEGGGGA